MRNSLVKKLFAATSLGLAWFGVMPQASAQLSVGPTGLAARSFSSPPTVAEFSTVSILPSAAGNITNGMQLDAAVQTNAAASVSAMLTTDASTPVPGANGIAQWNSSGSYLQTRVTGNSYTLLMAKLRNNTGSNVSSLGVSYTLGALVVAGSSIVEEVPGHRAYFSQTGATGSWVRIPEFDSATPASAGAKSATLNVGNWASSSNLFLLWADDNGSASATPPTAEGSYTIDDFAVTATPTDPLPKILTQPLAQSIAPGSTASFSVTVSGNTPLFFQWRKDAGDLGGATNSSFALPNAQVSDSGNYSVLVSNSFGTATSAVAVLTVSCADTLAFTMQPQNQSLPSGATLNLAVTVTGTAPLRFQWNRNGAALPGATNQSYTRPGALAADSGNYVVTVSNCLGVVTSSVAFVGIAAPPVTLLGLTNAFWKYNQSGTNLGTMWKETSFDDAAWPSGRGLLAWESGNAVVQPLTNTVLSLSNAGNFVVTYYFRAHFTLTNDPQTVVLMTSNIIDDGAVFYINGVEFQRFNMGAGTITPSTLALVASTEGVFTSIIIPASLVVTGDNVLAVEVHQSSTSSSDIVFGSALIMEFIPPGPPLFLVQPANGGAPRGASVTFAASVRSLETPQLQWFHAGALLADETNSTLLRTNLQAYDAGEYFLRAVNSYAAVTSRVAYLSFAEGPEHLRLLEFTNLWRYEISPGSTWTAPAYDDSAWLLGRGVFVHSSLTNFPETTNTYLPIVTDLGASIVGHYFRTHFPVPLGLTNLFFVSSNLIDDAAVFYLNGVEATRVRIESTPNSTTIYGAPGNGQTYDVLRFPGVNLSAGDNVLAVTVLQPGPNSADVVFGMNLLGYAAGNLPPSLNSPPASQNKAEGQSALFAAHVFGSVPMEYQWFRNGLAVPGATNARLSLGEAHPSNAGTYQFIASNNFGAVTSTIAMLTVTTDTAPPTLLRAFVTNGLSNVVVVFSEPVTEASATNLANYSLSPGAVILSAQLTAPNQVLLLISGFDVQLDYTLTVGNVLDHADNPNGLVPGSTVRVRPNILQVANGLLNVQTVFIIVMNNQSWSQIKDSTNLPYLNSLLPQASYCEQYFAPNNAHPSDRNFIWLEAGDDFGIYNGNGPVFNRIVSTNHLSTQLSQAGVAWRGYMEDMAYGSVGVTNGGAYLGRHNPFAFFDDVTTNYNYCTNHVRPYAEFAGDLAANRIGRYNFISPNAYHDMDILAPGSTSLTKQGDDWLALELPQILNSTAYSNNGAVFILWDSNDYSDDYPIGMIVLSPLAKRNSYASSTFYNHSSTLRTMQDIFGVRPYLGDAANASSLNDLFRTLSLRVAPSNGVAGVWLDNVRPGRTNYVQASSNLVHWATISTNMGTDAVFVPDPGAAGSPQRFYRALQQP